MSRLRVLKEKAKRRLTQEDLVRIVDKVEKAATGRNVDLMQRVSRSSVSARNLAGKGATRPDRGAVRVLAAELVV